MIPAHCPSTPSEGELLDQLATARRRGLPAEVDRLCWALALTVESVMGSQIRSLSRSRRAGQELADLMQIARLGAFRAAQRFDPSREVPFSAYASWWIRAELNAATENHGTLLKVQRDHQREIPRLRDALQAGVASPQLLAQRLELALDRVLDLLAVVHGQRIPEPELEGIDEAHPEAVLLRAEARADAAARWGRQSPKLIGLATMDPSAGPEAWRLIAMTSPDALLNDPDALALLRRVAQATREAS